MCKWNKRPYRKRNKDEPLAKADYIEIVDSETLQPVESVERDVLVAIAVYIGKTRLIDNFTFRLV